MKGRVLTLWPATWYGRGGSVPSSDAMIFGNGLMGQLGFEEIFVPLELWRDDPVAFVRRVKSNYPYDWVFIVPFTDVLYELKDLVREAPIVAWMCDDVWRYSSFGRYWAGVADLMVTTSPEVAKKYGAKGMVSNWGCRPEWEVYGLSAKVDAWHFRGQMYGRRKETAQAILEAGPVIGGFEDSIAALAGEGEYFSSMAGYTFSVCLTGSSGGPAHMKSRLFEPQVLESVLVTESVPHLEDYWEDGRECIVFTSPAEAQEKMSALLANREKLSDMKAAARARALGEHTYAKHRFPPILERIGL